MYRFCICFFWNMFDWQWPMYIPTCMQWNVYKSQFSYCIYWIEYTYYFVASCKYSISKDRSKHFMWLTDAGCLNSCLLIFITRFNISNNNLEIVWKGLLENFPSLEVMLVQLFWILLLLILLISLLILWLILLYAWQNYSILIGWEEHNNFINCTSVQLMIFSKQTKLLNVFLRRFFIILENLDRFNCGLS